MVVDELAAELGRRGLDTRRIGLSGGPWRARRAAACRRLGRDPVAAVVAESPALRARTRRHRRRRLRRRGAASAPTPSSGTSATFRIPVRIDAASATRSTPLPGTTSTRCPLARPAASSRAGTTWTTGVVWRRSSSPSSPRTCPFRADRRPRPFQDCAGRVEADAASASTRRSDMSQQSPTTVPGPGPPTVRAAASASCPPLSERCSRSPWPGSTSPTRAASPADKSPAYIAIGYYVLEPRRRAPRHRRC